MRAELEAAIEDNPYDARGYAVLGDHLQEIGDPRGELIALQLGSRSGAMTHTAAQYFDAHRDVFDIPNVELGWACGYARSATIENAKAFVVRGVLKHPSARFLTELRIRGNDVRSSVELVTRQAPRALRVLHVRHESSEFPLVLHSLWVAVPRLVELDVQSQASVEIGELVAPELVRLRLWSAGAAPLDAIGRAQVPKLTWLSLRKGKRDRRDDIEDSVRRAFPALSYLEIR